ncbi:hypothetical protein N7533_011633 [Penicillium manginii]|uniref:uncharacterized protein n=1 Tax=Penicillium manginii TaxID=203109 RepID=UPI002549BE50|nr:uncharacterized protein N7533_011633 [Penicillium manginii]KAJ5742224.1 hypothetical protein N7533_011633 [Penicillium manginii]
MVVHQGSDELAEAKEVDGLTRIRTTADKESFHTYSIVLECSIRGDKVDLSVNYDQRVIEQAQMARVLAHLKSVLHRLQTGNLDQAVSRVNALSKDDVLTIEAWNAEPPRRVDQCVHHAITVQAKQKPQAIAIHGWDGKFTYSQLDELTNRLAAHLVKLGVCAEQMVPICMEKSVWATVAMIAVWKAGGAYVALSPEYPVARREAMMSQLDAQVLVVSPATRASAGVDALHMVQVSASLLEELKYTPSEVDLANRCSPENLAYIIFTSGSTGVPKGVMIDHAAASSSIAAHGARMHFSAETRALQFAPYHFDACIAEIFTTLVHGGCVCVPSDEDRSPEIVHFMNEYQTNWAFFTPSFVRVVQPSRVHSLTTLVLGGEALQRDNIEAWAGYTNLMNGYGPTETCVFCVTRDILPTTAPTEEKLGFPVGSIGWIADESNPDQLAPIGTVGELLVEGPTLARGYLHDEHKTAASFIINPSWSVANAGPSITRRMYRTGDLVRYSDDGSINYVGRADSQIKLYGQRMEIGEVEGHLLADPAIHSALVLVPKLGLCADRLVTVVSLADARVRAAGSPLELVETVDAHSTRGTRERLAHNLPPYMVPTVWLVVKDIPMNASDKLDRAAVSRWIHDLDQDTYESTLSVGSEDADFAAKTSVEESLQSIVGRVLNLSPSQVPLNKSFISLGGDSITAMQVLSSCKATGISVRMGDILQSSGIHELCKSARVRNTTTMAVSEEVDKPFSLSPIQSFFFQLPVARLSHFNQSFFVRLAHPVDTDCLASAVRAVVHHHSMLRARFTKSQGQWSQMVSSNIDASYRLTHHAPVRPEAVEPILAAAQQAFDLEQGPLFAVDLIQVSGQDQPLLFLAAHHLVVDLVSWRVILADLEEALLNGQITAPAPLPFQHWVKLQAEYAAHNLSPSQISHGITPAADYSYWGMANTANIVRDTAKESMLLDAESTSNLLHMSDNAFRAEPVDVLMAAILHAFVQEFPTRDAPALFTEGHGRQPWDEEIDLSRTVGWFTTMTPVHVAKGDLATAIESIRQVKEARSRLSRHGWSYFTSRFANDAGIEAFAAYWPMELTFNYLGQYQQLEAVDAFFKDEPRQVTEASSDIDPDFPRFALIELSAVVVQGHLRLDVAFNQRMKHQDQIRHFASRSIQVLKAIADALPRLSPKASIGDYPLLSARENGLEVLHALIPQLGLSSIAEIEDVYPCSPMQQGLLIGQLRMKGSYEVEFLFEVESTNEPKVDVEKLLDAWQQVVQRHAVLRTVFVTGLADNAAFSQVVLKVASPRTQRIQCSDDRAMHLLQSTPRIDHEELRPAHQLLIVEGDRNRVLCRFEVNHALMDAVSMGVTLQDLGAAYRGLLPSGTGPLYSAFVKHIHEMPTEEALSYWTGYLAGAPPCILPSHTGTSDEANQLHSVRFNVSPASTRSLRAFCERHSVTMPNLFQAVWGLVLRLFVATDDVCFGYMLSGRESPIDGIHDAIGPFVSMSVSRLHIAATQSVAFLAQKARDDYSAALQHQNCSLAEVQHALRNSGERLFNTMMSVQRAAAETSNQHGLAITHIGNHDPTEYEMAVNVSLSDDATQVQLNHYTGRISSWQAENVADTFHALLRRVEEHGDQSIAAFNALSPRNELHLKEWNAEVPRARQECIHKLVEAQAAIQPEARAVHAGDAAFTYEQLDELSTRLSLYLTYMGVDAGSIVPLCFEKSAWTIVAMLAVLKVGAAFVCLDPAHPSERHKKIVLDIESSLILASATQTERASSLADDTITVDRKFLDSLPQVNKKILERAHRSNRSQPSEPAVIIYTSGSTGEPKGVVLSHSNLATSMHAHGEALRISTESRVLQFAAYVFDISIHDIFTSLTRGACICVPSDDQRVNELELVMQQMEVNYACITPTVARLLQPSALPSLKTLVLAGEAITQETLDVWGNSHLTSFHNCYGPAECTIFCAWNGNVGTAGMHPANIGRGLASRLWVVDPENQDHLMPIGCIGELAVGGPLVSQGYLHDEAKTTRAFITDPVWSATPGDRLYKTGDLVRYNQDGSLDYLGRKDTQVKIHGQRVELGEIEAQIRAASLLIREVAVDAVSPRDRAAPTRLAAFVCFTEDVTAQDHANEDEIAPLSDRQRAIVAEVLAALSQALPQHMLPSAVIPVREMPLNLSRKIDRSRLRQMGSSLSLEELALFGPGQAEEKEAPTNPAEEQLRTLWADVLGLPGCLHRENRQLLPTRRRFD